MYTDKRDARLGITKLRRQDPDACRAEIIDALERHRGVMVAVAFELFIVRRHLYRLIAWLDLWPEVDRIRLAQRGPNAP